MAYQVQPLPGYLQQAYGDDPRAQLASQLTQSGMQTTPTSWAGGLARLAQTLVGSYKGNQIRQNYQNQATDYRTKLAQALAGGDPQTALAQSSNPQLQEMGLQLQMQRAARAPQEQWRPMSPQEAQQRGLNPRGSYETSNFGQTRVVQAPVQPTIQDGFIIDPNDPAHPQQIPGWVQQHAAIAAAGRAPVLPPDAVREFQFAKSQGFDGSYTDYLAAKGQASSGTFGGGDNGKALTILTRGDPSSPEYASAYWLLSQPKVSVDQQSGQMTTIKPDMSKFRPPAGPGGAQPPVGDQGAAAPGAMPPAPSPPAVGAMPTQPGQAGGQMPPSVAQGASGAVPPAPAGPAAQPGVTVQSIGPRVPTEDQAKNNQLYTRTMQQLPIVLNNFDALSNLKDSAADSMLPNSVSAYVTSPQYQQAHNALTDIAASYLYSVSGATANPGEVANLVQTVTPRPGESDESKAQKKQRIQEMVDSIGLRTTQGTQQPGLAAPQAPGQLPVVKWTRDPKTGLPVPQQ